MPLPANYLPVRVTSFAVILARLSASLHEIAHTRAILSTYYEKKNRDKNRYFKYSTFEKPVPRRSEGAFVWDQSGITIIGIMQVSVCLGAILIPEYLDSILAILLPGAE